MKEDVFDYMIANIYKLTQMPVTVYKDGAICKTYRPKKWFDLTAFTEKALDTDDKINLFLSPQSLGFALVTFEKYRILLGPVRIMPLNGNMIRDIILENNLKLTDADELKSALELLPQMQLEYFAMIVAVHNTTLTHEMVTAEDYFKKLNLEFSELKFDDLLLQKQGQIIFGNKMPHNSYEYEQKMLYCIKNGLIEELHKMGNFQMDPNVDIPVQNSMRHYKNLLMAQKTLVSRAAIDGGADPEAVYILSDIYTHQIDNCQTITEISNLSTSIGDSFCNMVRELHYPKANDMIITQAIKYITDNITERITANDIADTLGISRVYLSSKFKKVMQQSLPEFINEQKIAVAKKLLKFSDKPLIEISNYLSFASQSYFQTQFRKVTGMTPLEFRNSNE